jgi:hypothetical protein
LSPASEKTTNQSSIFDEEEENTNEINSIEVENENIGVNPYQFEPQGLGASKKKKIRLLEVLFISPERLHRNRSGFLRSSLETLFYQLV